MNQNEKMLFNLSRWGKETDCEQRKFSAKDCKQNFVSKQNVIWIIADQMRADALSINGSKNTRTPNLDRLARFGVNFNKAVSAYPVCSAFRGALLTGKQHHKCVQGHQYGLEENQPTIASVFKDNGYTTAYFGKWHVDCRSDNGPHACVPKERRIGFDDWLGYDNNGMQWHTWLHGEYKGEEKKFKLNGFEADCLTDLFINYLKEKKDEEKPFFAVLSIFSPHPPYMAPSRNYREREIKVSPNVPQEKMAYDFFKDEMPNYCAMIENVDENVGRVLKALSECEMDMNTHVIFMSDHGDMMGSHGIFEKVVPYEESIRIPFIIGGAVPYMYGYKAGETDSLITEVDIATTTLGLCGIDKPEWMDGHDYSNHRIEKEIVCKEPQDVYIKAIVPSGYFNKPWRGVVTKDGWKYVCFEDAPFCLYNLNLDKYEQVNLLYRNGYGEKIKFLHQKLEDYVKKTKDCFSLPSVNNYVFPILKREVKKVKISKFEEYNTDCERMETYLKNLGVQITDKLEESDLYFSLDGVFHTYGCKEKVIEELQTAISLKITVIAVCMTQTNYISKFYKDNNISHITLELDSLKRLLLADKEINE